MTHGIAAPIALTAFGSAKAAPSPQSGRAAAAGLVEPNASAANRTGIIIRDFSDPYLELLRLLREAAEIEHGLMLQYLYCAFSVKAQ